MSSRKFRHQYPQSQLLWSPGMRMRIKGQKSMPLWGGVVKNCLLLFYKLLRNCGNTGMLCDTVFVSRCIMHKLCEFLLTIYIISRITNIHIYTNNVNTIKTKINVPGLNSTHDRWMWNYCTKYNRRSEECLCEADYNAKWQYICDHNSGGKSWWVFKQFFCTVVSRKKCFTHTRQKCPPHLNN